MTVQWHYGFSLLPSGFRKQLSPQPPFPSGCWLWTGDTVSQARARSYRLHIGKVPPRMRVTQTCGNEACVHPGHLSLVKQR